MAYRERVEPRIEKPRTQPVAAPVDTYVRPGVSQAEQLAKALAQVEPKLSRFSEEMLQRKHENDQERGRAAAREMARQGQTAAEMTRAGALPMQENAFFLAGLKEEMGRASASIWQSDLVAKMQNDPNYAHLKESTNIADFDQAATKHTADFLKTTDLSGDEYFEAGFGRVQAAYQQEQRLRFAYGIEDRLSAKTDNTIHARVMQVAEDDFGRGVDPDTTAKNIGVLAQQFIALGRPPDKVWAVVADAVEATARAQKDPEDGRKILALFGRVEVEADGVMVKLRQSKHGAERLEKAENDLIAEQFHNEQKAEEERRRLKQARLDEAIRLYGEALSKNPEDRGGKILDQFPDLRGELVGHFNALSRNEHGLRFSDNEYAYQKMLARIFDPAAGDSVTAATIIHAGGLSPETKQRLINDLEHYNKAKGSGLLAAIEKLPAFKTELGMADNYYKNQWNMVPNELTDRVANLKAGFRYRVMELARDGDFMKLPEEQQVKVMRELMSNLAVQDPGVQPLQQKPGIGIQWSATDPTQGRTPSSVHPTIQGQQKPSAPSGDPFATMPLLLPVEIIDGALNGNTEARAKALEAARSQGVPMEQMQNFLLSQLGKANAAKAK